MVMEEDASAITYASFFGGGVSNEHVDGGTCRFDRSGKIYQSVCAGCGNNDDFPIFPSNAWSATNNSNNCNNGVFKFDFALPITIASFSANNVCLPETPEINNNSTGAASYTWSVNGEQVATGSSPDLGINEPGVYEIQLVAFNPETCNQTDSLTQTIEVFPPVLLEPISDINLCEPEPIVLTANSLGTATSFQWSSDPDFSDQLNTSLADSTLSVSPLGTTTYYVLVSNGFCEETTSVTVTPAPQAELELLSASGCDGDTIEVNLNNLTPGITFESINWLPEAQIISGQGSDNVSFISEGSFYLAVSVLTENGCLIADSVLIESDELLLNVSPDTTICNDEQSVILIAESGGMAENYIWSENPDFTDPINAGGENSIAVAPSETTTYYIQATNGNCVRTEEVTVFVVSGSAQLPPEFLICSGDTLEIEAVNLIPSVELSFQWSPESEIISGVNSSTILVSPDETTVYEALITTEDGCVFSQSTVVFVSDLFQNGANATAVPGTIPAGTSTQLSALPFNENYSYVWTPADGLDNPFISNPTATPEQTTTYTVTIIDAGEGGECRVSAAVVVTVYDFICGMPNIYLPNAFTPNGDGNNDVLFLRGDNITSMHLAIYNRWGELVFETRNQDTGWDGTFRGKDVDPAVFVYHLEVVCGDGQQYFDKGNVTVIR
jgi:gliding motility-associated-like protein